MLSAPDLVELAKEFGGGFAAYWVHSIFHRVWHAIEHEPRRLRRGARH
jgi:hypothetical protein